MSSLSPASVLRLVFRVQSSRHVFPPEPRLADKELLDSGASVPYSAAINRNDVARLAQMAVLESELDMRYV